MDADRQALRAAAEALVPVLSAHARRADRTVVAVAGESGCGKTTLTQALAQHLGGHGVLVLSVDDYYHLVPADNHACRAADPDWVGPREVDLEALRAIVEVFAGGSPSVTVRELSPDRSSWLHRCVPLEHTALLLVEGTWAAMLPADVVVFIERDYRDTERGRAARARDPEDAVTRRVLAREHALLAGAGSRAHFVVGRDFVVRSVAASFSLD